MKKVFIQTYGCQMNERDSETMVGVLNQRNYVQTAEIEEADLILVNTCSIREHASEKAASQLGRLRKLKALRQAKIGVTGCLAQQEGKALLARFPFVDFVLGPDAIPKLGNIVEALEEQGDSADLFNPVEIDRDLESPEFLHEYLSYPVTKPDWREKIPKVKAYITISKGCDFRCTFCVVPNTRGPERSDQPEKIVEEVRSQVEQGVREVILLGQNVNSYGKNFAQPFYFPQLLRLLEESIPRQSALARIRFTTSHPVDLSDELMRAFAELPRLCGHLHLPVQSASDRVLRRMKRLYTIADYRKRIEELRRYLPGVSLTTDIIVGFPGEEEEDIQRTLDFIEEVGYTNLYAFAYSKRPFTPAQRLQDDVSQEIKDERLKRVLSLQQRISRSQNQVFKGELMEVLVEGPNRRGEKSGVTGRTRCSRPVHVSGQGSENLYGKVVDVRIDSALSHCLVGSYVAGSAR